MSVAPELQQLIADLPVQVGVGRVRQAVSSATAVEPTAITRARGLEVAPALTSVFPAGLTPGVWSWTGGPGAVATAFGLLPGAGWSAVVGLPDVNPEALLDWSVDLTRVVLVPAPGEAWVEVIGALAEAVDVVLAVPPARIAPREAERLTSRLRLRGCALVVLGEWVRPRGRVVVEPAGWEGLGVGHGHLTERRCAVRVDERHRTRTGVATHPVRAVRAA